MRESLGKTKRPKPEWVPSGLDEFERLDTRLSLEDGYGIARGLVEGGELRRLTASIARLKSPKTRANRETNLTDVISRVVGNALFGSLKGKPISYSRSRPRRGKHPYWDELCQPEKIDSRELSLCVDALEESGYLDNYKAPQNDLLQEVSMFRATPKLIALARRAMPLDLSGLLKYDKAAVSFVELKEAKSTELLVYGETDETRALESLGRLWASVNGTYRTTCPPSSTDTVLGFEWFKSAFVFKGDWYFLGRLFHPLSEWPLEKRSQIEVEGSPTVECDYKALHINLLYAHFAKALCPGDAYSLATPPYNLDKRMGRKLAKIVCNVGAINCSSVSEAVKAVNGAIRGYYDDDGKWIGPRDLGLREWIEKERISITKPVIQSFVDAHKPIASQLFEGHGLLLQRMDSRILQRVLGTFVSRGLWIVPFHDSFRVQVCHEALLIRTMKEAFEKETGIELPLSYVAKK